jgi:hypothetical protein
MVDLFRGGGSVSDLKKMERLPRLPTSRLPSVCREQNESLQDMTQNKEIQYCIAGNPRNGRDPFKCWEPDDRR